MPIVRGDRHWQLFGRLWIDAKATGNPVHDAWNAALAVGADCEWSATDRAHARFPGLKWRKPF